MDTGVKKLWKIEGTVDGLLYSLCTSADFLILFVLKIVSSIWKELEELVYSQSPNRIA